MKKLLSEPLVQFISLGTLLYLLLNTLAPQQLRPDGEYQIVVDDAMLIRYLQTQAKTFDAQATQKKYQAMSASQKDTLVDDYVRDEVLVREALTLGLDQNDEVIRRRLMQKMEYVGSGFAKDVPAIAGADLRQFFEDNREDYRQSASISFTHVFFNGRRRGLKQAQAMAETQLVALNRDRVAFTSAAVHGDRFLFKRNYIDQSSESIRGHFGEIFEEQLFTLKPTAGWQGPFKSDYGVHLVQVKASHSSRLPKLEEVSSVVLADFRRQQIQALQREAVAKIREKYTVFLELML